MTQRDISLRDIPNVFFQTLRQVGLSNEYRYYLRRAILILEPYVRWRSGLEKRGRGDESVILMQYGYIYHPEKGWIKIPVLSFNSIWGAFKNALYRGLFDFYLAKNPESLKKLYTPDWKGSVGASIFSMKTGISNAKDLPNKDEVFNASWANPIWTVWGIGIDGSTFPQKKLSFCDGVPIFRELRLLCKRYNYARKVFPDLPEPPSLDDITSEGNSLIVKIHKQRAPIIDDWYRIYRGEVAIYPDELVLEGKKSDEKAFDPAAPTLVNLEVSPLLSPIISLGRICARKSGLFSEAEIASLVYSSYNVVTIGPKDNAFKMYLYMKFTHVVTGEDIELRIVKEPDSLDPEEVSEDAEKLYEKFRNWLDVIDYPSVLSVIREALTPLYKPRKHSGQNQQKQAQAEG